jgi:hypothetical protein
MRRCRGLVEAVQATSARLPTLDYTLGQISRRTVGRAASRALETYLAAFNRLLLIAPAPLLDPMEAINALLSSVDRRHDDAWEQEWSAARGALIVAARQAVRGPERGFKARIARFTARFSRSTGGASSQ